MTKPYRFRSSLLILAPILIVILIVQVIISTLFLIVTIGRVPLSTPLEINNITIEQIDKNTVRINWSTNKETYSGVDIDDPKKVSEILRNAFSCNITGDLIAEGYSGDTFKKYGCIFTKDKNDIPSFVHDGIIYGNCATDRRYFLCKGSENVSSKQHSVILNVLQPNTEYTFKIQAKVMPPEEWPKEFAEKSVKFKMPFVPLH